MRRLVSALALMSVLVIAACGSGTSTTTGGSTSTAGSNTSKATAPAATATATKQTAKVGDTITIDGVGTTLVSVKPIQPGEFDSAPDSGDTYYVLHLAIANTTANVVSYNVFEYTVYGSAGASAQSEYLSSEPSNKMLNSGNLAPNGHVEGDIVVELPTNDHGAKLVWNPGLSNTLENAWSLGL